MPESQIGDKSETARYVAERISRVRLSERRSWMAQGGDGTVTVGVVDDGNGTISGEHAYTTGGIFEVIVTAAMADRTAVAMVAGTIRVECSVDDGRRSGLESALPLISRREAMIDVWPRITIGAWD